MELEQELASQRRAKIYKMYRSGMTQTSIALIMGVSQSIVSLDIRKYVEENLTCSMQSTVSQQKAILLDRLQFFEEKIIAAVQKGDLKAVRLALEIVETKHKVLGLNRQEDLASTQEQFPFEVELFSNNSSEDLEGVGEEDLETLENIAAGKIPSKSSSKKKNIKALSDDELRSVYFESLKEV